MSYSPNADSANSFRGRDTPSTSSSLIERARRREEGAWERMTALYGPMVYTWCRRLGLRAEDAADTVQEVFLVVVDAIVGFRGGRTGAFRAWLRTVTQNKIRDGFRQTAGQPAAAGGSSAFQRLLHLPETVAPAEESLTDDSEEDVWPYAIEQVRAEFPAHVWEAFWRVTVDGTPTRTVAEELGMSVAAVYQAKSRVLRRLREDLRDMDVRE